MKTGSFIIIAILFLSCTENKQADKPLRWVEDIAFDSSLDNPDFQLCHKENQVYQYFNLGDNIEIKGEKWYIENKFKNEYKTDNIEKESGLIRIRFIVNCKGQTGRFRILESDVAYQEKQFDKSITDQLLNITKSLEDWGQKNNDNFDVDYYQYLVFKIIDGEIVKILP